MFSLYVSSFSLYASHQKVDLGNEILFWRMARTGGGNSPRSRKERFIFYLRGGISVRHVPTAGEEAVGFQFCRKANIVARPPESKTPLSLPLLLPLFLLCAYCAEYVKSNVYRTKWSRMNQSTSDGCISQVSRWKAVTSSCN